MNDSVIISPVRRRPADGLDQVIGAALRVFAERGYRQAQMADVARAMGVAPGTLYGYVAGKEALFHLVVDRAFADGAGAPAPELPVPTPAPGATLARLRQRLAADAALARLDGALRRRRAGDPRRELEGVVAELYDLIARSWPGIVVLERSAVEWPELARVFYADVRHGLIRRLERYLEARIAAGQLRPVPAVAAARFVLECVAWFAMHRHRDPDPAPMDDEAARQAVLDLVVNALATPGRPARRPARRARRPHQKEHLG
jgi:AcrR family transcriptional regulator